MIFLETPFKKSYRKLVRINNDDDRFNNFLRIGRNTLYKFASPKIKCISGNNAPFMNITLR